MWNRNPDYEKYPAAICYNKGYNFQHENKWSGRVRAELKLGEFLHTDYDCMYMEGGNQFYTHHEGGYINLAYMYHGRCNHDRRTGDLTCN
ncbi:hypothetical protein T440DRAFT_466247 [Plenodomus tracheiphilus IPT5]|uniref:DUF7888 domain-containing protein n=1 Tax=Plenodomus tracheiphilus IPT5 TaxID=1408161 RepID=A0A6A7BF06_9PLEO|nr:hypothetical protein T440DRAFT_466247 [Plenodomus tracheiphilus IPT5]